MPFLNTDEEDRVDYIREDRALRAAGHPGLTEERPRRVTRIAELGCLGYEFKYDTRGWEVSHNGVLVNKGGFNKPSAFDPTSASNAIALTRQCAIWVAEQHLRNETAT